jgi:hypothetical protein
VRRAARTEVAVSRQMFADILSLIARLGARMSGEPEVSRAPTGKPCLGPAIAARFNVSVPVNRQLRSPLAGRGRDMPLSKPVRSAILAPKALVSGKCRVNRAAFAAGAGLVDAAEAAVEWLAKLD